MGFPRLNKENRHVLFSRVMMWMWMAHVWIPLLGGCAHCPGLWVLGAPALIETALQHQEFLRAFMSSCRKGSQVGKGLADGCDALEPSLLICEWDKLW